ncbi:hypothetical protein NY667_18640 [Xanthomonas hortorum pv. hederae]|uniref:DUF1444 domain-containing protein n=1 Tax=Xanthomonas hortorum pv. hederae TaxID=453603 RepID=A0A9X4BUD7_9XANT|nr:hypothetical protein [Xanthomonas hortorum pv. hederae]MDC8639767.1 hypothetical protein [Xanthomonas hortorum pv. hederae]PPU80191.1 hypothetical protein XhhCFBP4925_12430 [Xanthomonas hortorum pv. hederae]PUE99630.1 hypothetical protein C7T87_13005 [Xanthomonas hortorum pv. hederae]
MFAALLNQLFHRKPHPDAFAKRFQQALRVQGYRGELVYVADEFRLVGANHQIINLHNAYHSYATAKRGERPEVLRRYAAGFLEGQNEGDESKTFEQVRPTLMPVIRNRGMLEEMRLEDVRTHGWNARFTAVFREIAEDCVQLLAIDRAESTSTLVLGPKPEWDITFDAGLVIAHENLRAVTADFFVEVAAGIFRGAWQDAYDTSRVVLPDVLQRVPVKGRPIFMMPTRDCLLVTGDRDEAVLTGLLELSLEAAQDGRCISSLVFAYHDRDIVPFAVSSPEHRRLQAELRRLTDVSNYATQQELLKKIYASNEEEIFAASCRVFVVTCPHRPYQ